MHQVQEGVHLAQVLHVLHLQQEKKKLMVHLRRMMMKMKKMMKWKAMMKMMTCTWSWKKMKELVIPLVLILFSLDEFEVEIKSQ